MATPSDFISADQLAGEFRDALQGVERLGVSIAGTRFEKYRDILDEVGAMQFPRRMVFQEDDEKHALYFEAISQGRQLIDAMQVLPHAPGNHAPRLRRIVGGEALPVPPLADEDSTDDARNILFELATAVALLRTRFEVELPSDRGPDLRAICGSLKPFLVECKRPQNDLSLKRSIATARKQLDRKLSPRGTEQGLVMVGIDRLVGLAATSFATTQDLKQAADVYLEEKWRLFTATDTSPFPTVTVGGVHLTGSVFVNELGGMMSVSLVRLFCAGPQNDPISMEIRHEMGRIMEIDRRDPPVNRPTNL